jgi:hypothetical protein
MNAYVITEGAFDKQLLQALLPQDVLKNTQIVAAGGISATKSLARSLVAERHAPIVIVMDADSTNPEIIQERRQGMEEVVKIVAGNTPVKVVMAVPQIESIFFQDPDLLARLFGYPLSQEIMGYADYQSNPALKSLLAGSNRTKLFEAITDKDTEILRNTPVIQDVVRFLRGLPDHANGTGKIQ